MKTRYDWKAGARWKLLEPDTATASLNQCIVADVTVDVAPLLALYLAERLRGQALVDAKAKYGEPSRVLVEKRARQLQQCGFLSEDGVHEALELHDAITEQTPSESEGRDQACEKARR